MALSGKSAFKKWVTYRKTGLFFQAIIPLKHLVCPHPRPPRADANPPRAGAGGAGIRAAAEATGLVSRNLSLALKTEFLFKRAEGSSTLSHLILFQKEAGAFT